MPCNSIATASATVGDLTPEQFKTLLEQMNASNISIENGEVSATLNYNFISYKNGEVDVQGFAWDVGRTLATIKQKTLDMRAVMIYLALEEVARVTESQKVPGGYVLQVEI